MNWHYKKWGRSNILGSVLMDASRGPSVGETLTCPDCQGLVIVNTDSSYKGRKF